VEAISLRELSVEQWGELFRSVVEYYKAQPSSDRALPGALSNDQAFGVAGISSKTMAKAKKGSGSVCVRVGNGNERQKLLWTLKR
jgi:hypothetical protein